MARFHSGGFGFARAGSYKHFLPPARRILCNHSLRNIAKLTSKPMSQQRETIPPFSEAIPMVNRSAARPTALQWALHALLFVATAITTTISGIVWVGAPDFDNASSPPATSSGLSTILLLPWYYLSGIISL